MSQLQRSVSRNLLLLGALALLPAASFSCHGMADREAPQVQTRSAKLASTPASTSGEPGGMESDKGGQGQKAKAVKTMPRKIIRDGEIRLVVKSYEPARTAIESMLEKSGGYLSSTKVEHNLGRVSSATLVVRVPARKFGGAIKLLSRLGVVQSESTSSKDITDEYYDLTARLSNAKKLEKRYLDLLQKHAAKVADLLQVERELARVRGEIERFEGKLRLYDNLVDLSTITIHLSIQQKYTPPRPPTLLGDMQDTLSGSIDALGAAARGLLLVVVALVPWLVPMVLFVVLVVAAARWRMRKQARQQRRP